MSKSPPASAPMTTAQLLKKLVSFDTISSNSNIELIDFVEDYLTGHGVGSVRIDYEAGRKLNLFATIGPDVAGGIVLSGHTDVVPVEGQNWTHDPFDMIERDGALYGRGTCDMKGFIAVVLALVPQLVAARLKTPVHMAWSCDEEVGCNGVRPMIAHVVENLPRPKAVIVGEPTSMQVVNSHKGGDAYHTHVRGLEGHSSNMHLGVSAIMAAGEVICEIGRMGEDMRRDGDPSGRFSPPCSTTQVGMVEGGTAGNIIAKDCHLTWETRLLPGVDVKGPLKRIQAFGKTLEQDMHKVSRETGIETRCVSSVPGLLPEPEAAAETLALNFARANGTGAVSYGTEAGLFQQAGFPAVICGPGSIEQAHKPDEFVTIAQLDECEAFMQRLLQHCQTTAP